MQQLELLPGMLNNTCYASLQFSVLLVLTLGVLNRVLQKMATVPLGNHLFFLAQFQTFGYVLFYGAILAQRRRSVSLCSSMQKS